MFTSSTVAVVAMRAVFSDSKEAENAKALTALKAVLLSLFLLRNTQRESKFVF